MVVMVFMRLLPGVFSCSEIYVLRLGPTFFFCSQGGPTSTLLPTSRVPGRCSLCATSRAFDLPFWRAPAYTTTTGQPWAVHDHVTAIQVVGISSQARQALGTDPAPEDTDLRSATSDARIVCTPQLQPCRVPPRP